MIIGITGEARHGKGTSAQAMKFSLQGRSINVQMVSFADPLKDFLTGVVGRSEPFRGTDEQRNAPVPEVMWVQLSNSITEEARMLGWLENAAPTDHPTGRQLMQLFGTTTVRDNFLHDAWIRIAKNKAARFQGITIIDDVRFDNEADATDLLVKVFRPGHDNGAASRHASETGPRSIPADWIDANLINDGVGSLKLAVRKLIGDWYVDGRFSKRATA